MNVTQLILVPGIVGWQADSYTEEHECEHKGLIKAGACFVSFLVMFKIFQLGKSVFLRKPIKSTH